MLRNADSNNVISLVFSPPELLTTYFEVPIDKTCWMGEYRVTTDRFGKKNGQTPAREQASFSRWQDSLLPKSDVVEKYSKCFGVYLLTMDIPTPAIYVGIAVSSAGRPEGVLTRIRKHRVKLTGSHIGRNGASSGGVNHTGGWRSFAPERARHFAARDETDGCRDVRIITGTMLPIVGGNLEEKAALEYFESRIADEHSPVWEQLTNLLWPRHDELVPRLLTLSTSGKCHLESARVTLWNNRTVEC
jgi:hypothetical protein